jgi:HEAT repeat protein
MVRALGALQDAQTIPLLVSLLDDPDPAIRWAATRAPGRFKDPQAISRIIPILISELTDPENQSAARAALRQLRDAGAIPTLARLLSHYHGQVRASAAYALGVLKDARIILLLTPLLADPAPLARLAAVKALMGLRGKHNIPSLVAPLAPLCADFDWTIQQEAVRTLGRLGDAQAVPLLTQMLANPDAYAPTRYHNPRMAAIKALGAPKDPQVIPILAPLLSEPDRRKREAAARALGQLQDPQIVPLLAPLVADSAWSVRQAAIRALRPLVKL